jgi:hypothetical protein
MCHIILTEKITSFLTKSCKLSTYDWEPGNIAHIGVAIKLCLGKRVDMDKSQNPA